MRPSLLVEDIRPGFDLVIVVAEIMPQVSMSVVGDRVGGPARLVAGRVEVVQGQARAPRVDQHVLAGSPHPLKDITVVLVARHPPLDGRRSRLHGGDAPLDQRLDGRGKVGWQGWSQRDGLVTVKDWRHGGVRVGGRGQVGKVVVVVL